MRRTNRIAFWLLATHLPIMIAIAWFNSTGALAAGLLTSAVLAGPFLAAKTLSLRGQSVVVGIATMLMGGLLVHFGQGPAQTEMHFYFLLA